MSGFIISVANETRQYQSPMRPQDHRFDGLLYKAMQLIVFYVRASPPENLFVHAQATQRNLRFIYTFIPSAVYGHSHKTWSA